MIRKDGREGWVDKPIHIHIVAVGPLAHLYRFHALGLEVQDGSRSWCGKDIHCYVRGALSVHCARARPQKWSDCQPSPLGENDKCQARGPATRELDAAKVEIRDTHASLHARAHTHAKKKKQKDVYVPHFLLSRPDEAAACVLLCPVVRDKSRGCKIEPTPPITGPTPTVGVTQRAPSTNRHERRASADVHRDGNTRRRGRRE